LGPQLCCLRDGRRVVWSVELRCAVFPSLSLSCSNRGPHTRTVRGRSELCTLYLPSSSAVRRTSSYVNLRCVCRASVPRDSWWQVDVVYPRCGGRSKLTLVRLYPGGLKTGQQCRGHQKCADKSILPAVASRARSMVRAASRMSVVLWCILCVVPLIFL
jgi:hypothetical protein